MITLHVMLFLFWIIYTIYYYTLNKTESFNDTIFERSIFNILMFICFMILTVYLVTVLFKLIIIYLP